MSQSHSREDLKGRVGIALQFASKQKKHGVSDNVNNGNFCQHFCQPLHLIIDNQEKLSSRLSRIRFTLIVILFQDLLLQTDRIPLEYHEDRSGSFFLPDSSTYISLHRLQVTW